MLLACLSCGILQLLVWTRVETCAQVCDLWVHFSCDPRAQQGQLGSFREYAVADGRAFTCIACTEVKKKSKKER